MAENEKTLLPPSTNGCTALPPMDDRSAITLIPLLVGFVPGVTVTVNTVEVPASGLEGFAAPTPDGDVGANGVVTVNAMLADPCRP